VRIGEKREDSWRNTTIQLKSDPAEGKAWAGLVSEKAFVAVSGGAGERGIFSQQQHE